MKKFIVLLFFTMTTSFTQVQANPISYGTVIASAVAATVVGSVTATPVAFATAMACAGPKASLLLCPIVPISVWLAMAGGSGAAAGLVVHNGYRILGWLSSPAF